MGTEFVESLPDPGRTIEGLRDTGYSFETAVADLVDNSIAAGAENISIRIMLDHWGSVRLFIVDDGSGMDKERLGHAMRYGSPKRADPSSLGKYGLGLKTASTAFCRRLSLISRTSGSSSALMATWDLDHVIEKGRWELEHSDDPDEDALQYLDEVAPDASGTVVLWDKVDRLLRDYQDPQGKPARNALKKHCAKLKDHLGMVYQRFLDVGDSRARNININMNGGAVESWDPFQRKLSEVVADEEPEFEGFETDFRVRAYILPRREEFPDNGLAKKARLSSDMQGLYIYREHRLIHHADWLGMFQQEPHSTLLRVEFSFDHRLDDAFHLDIKKSKIILNEELWNWLRDQFLTAPRREANRRYRQGRKIKTSEQAATAHTASNNSIREKEAEVGGAEVSVSDQETGEATVKNERGEFKMKIKTSAAARPGEVCVQPAQGVEDGLLFEPALIEQHKAVRINTQHPYYHKVYVPNLSRSVTVQGMDSLLWAFCVAELSTTTDKTRETFEDMRYFMSRSLRKLVESLPEPVDDEDPNET